MDKDNTELDPEIGAISAVYTALKALEPEAQARVLHYVAGKLKLAGDLEREERAPRVRHREEAPDVTPPENPAQHDEGTDDGLEGISPTAKKWIVRNGLDTGELSRIFSLGIDEIDLVAKAVPGSSKRDRLRSVFLLKGIASYLGTGVARFTHEQMKEAALHYDAFDAANFAATLKNLSSEVSGDKSAGYALTTRGLTSATEMVKEILKTSS